MPRAESHKFSSSAGTPTPWDLGYDTDTATSDSSSSSYTPSSHRVSIPPRPSSTAARLQKKRHICQTCERGFTTSGHLARHVRIHTRERNHACPFPGCERRCSRQDNLQQHYRVHFSPGSRVPGNRKTPRRRARTVMPPSSDISTPSPSHSTSRSLRVSPSTEGTLKECRAINSSPPPLASAALYPEGANSLTESPPSLSTTTVPTVYSSSATTYSTTPQSLSGRDSASPEPCYTLPTLEGAQYPTMSTSYLRDSSSYNAEQARSLGFTYPGSTSSYRQPYTSSTPVPQQAQLSTECCDPQPLIRSHFSSGSLHEVHTLHPTPPTSPLSSRHSISHIANSLPEPLHQPQFSSYAKHSGASTLTPSSPMSSQSLPAQTARSHSSSYSGWTKDVQQPYVPSQPFDSSPTSYFTSTNANVSPTTIQNPSSYVMSLSSHPCPLSTTAPLTTDTTISRYPSPRPILAPLHEVHTQVQNFRLASVPVLERHYSAPSVMAVQPQQVYDASQSYAYERQSYGIEQDVGGYGWQDVYGYRDISMWKDSGVGALAG